MSNTDSPADCLDRARMHDRLADVTEDSAARTMHRAMAAEFRRRASAKDAMAMPLPRESTLVAEMQVEMY